MDQSSPTTNGINRKAFNDISCSGHLRNKVKKLMKKNIVQEITVDLFHKHGKIVGRHPYLFMIIPFLITAGLSAGVFAIKFQYTFHEYFTPTSSGSFHESKVFEEFFNDTGGTFLFYAAIGAKDNGSLLRPQYRKEILHLIRYLTYNYTVTVDNNSFTFNDIQINHKDDSKLPVLLMEYYNTSKLPIEYTYPVAKINGESYHISIYFRNVTIDNNTNIMQNFTTLVLFFNSAKGNQEHFKKLRTWANSFLKVGQFDDVAPDLYFYFFNEAAFAQEMLRNARSAVPFVVLGFGVLTLFAVSVSISTDPTKHKPWETLASILCVLLATGSSLGLLFLVGFPFIGTMTVTPILVLALGMDVTYITLRNWRSTDSSHPTDVRLSETLAESGPSIIITTLTNVLSAAIGCITNIKGVYIFSLANAIAVSILFLLQITIFAAAVALGGERERLQKHGFLFCLTVKSRSRKDKDVTQQKLNNSDWWCTVSKFMAKCLSSTYCKIIVSITLVAYWATSIYGCAQVNLGLTPDKLILDDSPLTKMINFDKSQSNSVAFPLYIFVSNPPNFDNINETNKFRKMVGDFESLPGCYGSSATSLWLRSMDEQFSFFDDAVDDKQSFYKNLAVFLGMASGKRWLHYMTIEKINDTVIIDKFMFTVTFNYTKDWNVRSKYTDMWRDTAARYPEFNVSSWGGDTNNNFVTDNLAALPGNAIQDIICTTVCMGLVCIMYIPNIFNTVCAIITVVSISAGVFGYLCLWGVNLEPISLTCFLISIGYSVDFTSHISYHYYTSDGKTNEEKLASSLSSIGLPMLETGVSTVLTIGCLCFGPSYYTEWVFFKIILLTVLLGLLHGLIFLPTFLAWIPVKYLQTLFANRKRVSSASVFNVESNSKADNLSS